VFQILLVAWFVLLAVHAYWSTRSAGGSEQTWLSARVYPLCRILELVITNVALTLVLGELAMRTLGAATGSSLVLRAAVDGYRLTPGQDYGAGLRGNQLGYPGPDFQVAKRPGVRRIAALGDSFAVGTAVPFADNYLTLLERILPGSEVYNFGVAGAGPREYLHILQRDVWTYQPDLVLVSIFVGNDITEQLATPRHFDPRQHALYLAFQRSWCLLEHRTQGLTATCPDNRCKTAGLSPERFREVEARRLAVCVSPSSSALEKKWRQALEYLQQIIADARRNGVPLAVVLIPDEFQVNPHVLAPAIEDAGFPRPSVVLNLPQQRLSTFFRERGVPCLDLLPTFEGESGTYVPYDTHWSVAGNRLAADALKTWLHDLK
jgi:hypothetical protein